ncbi:MAG: thioredoxin domain-containing protein [Thiothrix sp.]|nr:thioredoxin domain-containing protein [Thiothrix sp.]HPQ95530.1 thioredoxin domain-containing protein [Thiolinea sp.]
MKVMQKNGLFAAKPLLVALGVALLSAGPWAQAEEAGLFELGGKAYTSTDLPAAAQQNLYKAGQDFYMARKNAIDEAIMTMELEKRARESGKGTEELAMELFKVDSIPDEAVNQFYEANKAAINQPLEQIKPQIQQYLIQQAQGEKQRALIEDVKKAGNFKLDFAEPTAPVVGVDSAGFPFKGPEDAKVILVEFADYQCPHCKNASEVIGKVSDQFKDSLKVVFMDFPINRSGISRTIAEGAVCADQQGKFWEYNARAFAMQRDLKAESREALAQELGLDMDAFKQCVASDVPKQTVAKAQAEGQRLGVDGTPALFLNGVQLDLHNLEQELPAEVEKALNEAEG